MQPCRGDRDVVIHAERFLQFLEPRERSAMPLPAERLEHLECIAQTFDAHPELVKRSGRSLVVELAPEAHRAARDQSDQLRGRGTERSISTDLFDRGLRNLRGKAAKG